MRITQQQTDIRTSPLTYLERKHVCNYLARVQTTLCVVET
ncbi:hypothetical protein [Methylomonas albis]|nr:hypothetical protein [Methylomonas albis]